LDSNFAYSEGDSQGGILPSCDNLSVKLSVMEIMKFIVKVW